MSRERRGRLLQLPGALRLEEAELLYAAARDVQRYFPMRHLTAATMVVLALTSLAHGVEPYEVETGLWTCPRGYVIRQGKCLSMEDLAGPKTEVSKLPSAGNGAPTSCPSGGCETAAGPSVSVPNPFGGAGGQAGGGAAGVQGMLQQMQQQLQAQFPW